MKKYLNVDNCIIIHDVEQIKKEPAAKKTKTKRQLSKAIFNANILEGASELAIYTKLWRFEKEGYVKEPTELIDAVLQVLDVSRCDLVKEL